MIFPRSRRALQRYGRNKVIAILVTFAVFTIYLKVFVPKGVVLSKLDWEPRRTSPREAFDGRMSGVVVSADGVVEALLADSSVVSAERGVVARLKRSRVRTLSDFPVVVLWEGVDGDATRLEPGDPVRFRGIYDWTTGGGVVLAARSDSSAFGLEVREPEGER